MNKSLLVLFVFFLSLYFIPLTFAKHVLTLGTASRIKLTLDLKTGAYTINIANKPWFQGNTYGMYSRRWFSNLDGSLTYGGYRSGTGSNVSRTSFSHLFSI